MVAAAAPAPPRSAFRARHAILAVALGAALWFALNQHGGGGRDSGSPHDDVDVLLGAEVRGKTAFVDHIIGQPDAQISTLYAT